MTGELVVLQPGQKLDTLATVPGDFADWILAGMGIPASRATVSQPHQGDVLPPPEQVGAVVISGSGAMVTEQAPWMQACEAWLRELVGLDRPVLGICFGHQLLAHALGGEVADNPGGIEVGTVITRPTAAAAHDPLFRGWPAQAAVQASHVQSVIRLPEGAVRLAASDQDPNHAFRYGAQTWGVQFHPEFDAGITAAYEAHYRPWLDDSYRDGMAGRRKQTPQGGALLRAFAAQIAN